MRTLRPFRLASALLAVLLLPVPGRAALFAPDEPGAGGADSCTLVAAVRHAEKDPEGGNDPGLTEAGQARAQTLADVLAQAHVQTILVSPTRRARETAGPVAERTKIEPRAIPFESGAEWHVAALTKAVRSAGGKTVLVVGHSNTIPMLLRALGLDVKDLTEDAYDDLFLVTLCGSGPPRLVRASFGASDGRPADKRGR